jgi:hypothetical protein
MLTTRKPAVAEFFNSIGQSVTLSRPNEGRLAAPLQKFGVLPEGANSSRSLRVRKHPRIGRTTSGVSRYLILWWHLEGFNGNLPDAGFQDRRQVRLGCL